MYKRGLMVFWVMTPFNFVQLQYHNKESDGKSILIAELEKDQRIRWDKFCPNQSYYDVMPHFT